MCVPLEAIFCGSVALGMVGIKNYFKNRRKKKEKKYYSPFFWEGFGIGATIRIGQEVQCLPHAKFF